MTPPSVIFLENSNLDLQIVEKIEIAVFQLEGLELTFIGAQ